jgi:putative FmdB family regulatory protein
MPLFEFRCRTCHDVFEALVRPTDPPPHCPACQGVDLERLLTSFAVKTPERSQASASAKRAQEAAVARRDNVAREREIDEHRKEDH